MTFIPTNELKNIPCVSDTVRSTYTIPKNISVIPKNPVLCKNYYVFHICIISYLVKFFITILLKKIYTIQNKKKASEVHNDIDRKLELVLSSCCLCSKFVHLSNPIN